MSGFVIAAIPSEDEPVWEISSEKIPHLTLLYLGESDQVNNPNKIVDFVEHAANVTLTRFYLDVDKRGVLGDDNADVVFFKGWDLPELARFRNFLLMDNNIAKAYHATSQFPEWQPHLTLGYPATPAKKPKTEQHLYSIRFDRIAVWSGDFEGPIFELKTHDYPLEVAMSVGSDAVEDVLSHYGVKGMKWGVRKSDVPAGETRVTQKGKKLKGEGGKGLPPHPDATKAAISKQKAKGSGLQALSNKELKDLQTRMNLEQNVRELSVKEKNANANPAAKFIKRTLLNSGKNEVQQASNRATSKAVANMMKKR